jgi:hypothetical protein
MSGKRKITYVLIGVGVGLLLLYVWRAWKKKNDRPTLEDAESLFRSNYPDVKILNLKITEDEIYARNFLFRYMKPDSDAGKSIEIQFMRQRDTGRWIPVPAIPAELK